MWGFLGCAGPGADTDLSETADSADSAPDSGASPGESGIEDTADTDTGGLDSDVVDSDVESTAAMAFFYQNVGFGLNDVRWGTWSEEVVDSSGFTAMSFDTMGEDIDPLGDPLFSRWADGRWSMAAASGMDHPSGIGQLLLHLGECPVVDDNDALHLLTRSDAEGCAGPGWVLIGKGSQVFSHQGSDWLFMNTGPDVMLVRAGDGTQDLLDHDSLCYLTEAPDSLDDIAVGEGAPILHAPDTDLLLSDVAIARRLDGTWTLFIKGIPQDSGCMPLSKCELCSRGIYRSTSTDLLHWTQPELVASEASVPDAANGVNGEVWLFWQDFSEACDAGTDQEFHMLAARAPLTGAFEGEGGVFSAPMTLTFPEEAFENDPQLHYPTNPNPILLPDAAALSDLESCFL